MLQTSLKPTLLLIITGSIAAPKALDLLKLLNNNFKVIIILTPNAKKFIRLPASLMTHETFLEQDFYHKDDKIKHIDYAINHDLIVVYPATMSFLSKSALALPENLALATFLASNCAKILFPAMNTNMYFNPALQRNIALLQLDPLIYVTTPVVGPLAEKINGKRMVGMGRLKTPEQAYEEIMTFFATNNELSNKMILINYGATRSYIDDLRYITNSSSGKMGFALVQAFLAKNAKVIAVVGDHQVKHFAHKNLTIVNAITNAEMLTMMLKYFDQADVIISAAALNDYQINKQFSGKIDKTQFPAITLPLITNIDILEQLGKKKKPNQLLFGFSLQADEDLVKAQSKMKAKNCDGIILNNIKVIAADNTTVNFYFCKKLYTFSGEKTAVACKITAVISKFINCFS